MSKSPQKLQRGFPWHSIHGKRFQKGRGCQDHVAVSWLIWKRHGKVTALWPGQETGRTCSQLPVHVLAPGETGI